ncbi:hypothetical protein [Streptomyces sp. DH24]|uniref:hypothetical protein n=1 Tax=Streptomyces sp. DH24 TaxID=3040123 RepID=UPI002441005F|nr:hypothetical protein [Streptomyces sp. DH24]MDG9715698.1 hypothetical protein [Streptomyces sp. DH24]
MDIARALARIELLCSGDLPAEHGGPGCASRGPGYTVAELTTSGDFWERGPAEWERTEEQFDAYRDGLSERLTARWGAPHLVGLAGVFERSQSGEDIPEPWGTLSCHVPDLHLWRIPDRDRWMALGVSQWDRELPFQLLAVVTDVDPP